MCMADTANGNGSADERTAFQLPIRYRAGAGYPAAYEVSPSPRIALTVPTVIFNLFLYSSSRLATNCIGVESEQHISAKAIFAKATCRFSMMRSCQATVVSLVLMPSAPAWRPFLRELTESGTSTCMLQRPSPPVAELCGVPDGGHSSRTLLHTQDDRRSFVGPWRQERVVARLDTKVSVRHE